MNPFDASSSDIPIGSIGVIFALRFCFDEIFAAMGFSCVDVVGVVVGLAVLVVDFVDVLDDVFMVDLPLDDVFVEVFVDDFVVELPVGDAVVVVDLLADLVDVFDVFDVLAIGALPVFTDDVLPDVGVFAVVAWP